MGWQSFYPECFEREMGCTEAEWLRWLAAALGEYPYELAARTATVRIGAGRLRLTWQVGAPRTIALLHLPRLRVNFEFSRLNEAERFAFMHRFDLGMQRGGG